MIKFSVCGKLIKFQFVTTRDKAALKEQVSLLEASLTAMTQREQEALGKLKNALKLAEDTHSHTTQVRRCTPTYRDT